MTTPTEADVERARHWLDPTPEMLSSPAFNAIWSVIKTWDINVPAAYEGYCGATGNHVRAILDALDPALSAARAEGIAQGRTEVREIDAPVIEAARRVYGEAHQRLGGIRHDGRYAGAISDLGDALAARDRAQEGSET